EGPPLRLRIEPGAAASSKGRPQVVVRIDLDVVDAEHVGLPRRERPLGKRAGPRIEPADVLPPAVAVPEIPFRVDAAVVDDARPCTWSEAPFRTDDRTRSSPTDARTSP